LDPIASALRQLTGILLLVAIGCATQPDPAAPSSAPAATPVPQAPLPPKASLSARVGVEFLPTDPTARGPGTDLGWRPEPLQDLPGSAGEDPVAEARVQVEPARPVSPLTESWSFEPSEQPSELPWLSKEALMRIEDPAERFTLHFLNQLIGDDRRRVTREFGSPILFNRWRYHTPSQGLDTHLDIIDREDQALMLSRESRHLVRRPLGKALRKSKLLAPMVDMIDDVKASIPFTQEYQRRQGTSYGSFSLKLRPSDHDNPFEVGYRNMGWRIGSGPGRLRIGYESYLTDDLLISIRTRYDYDPGRFGISANLRYRVDDDTTINVLASDRVDIITGSAMYPVIRSPVTLESVDNSEGVLFYVEHLF
jgi:hypothetical protein